MSGEPPLIVHVIHHLVVGGMENGVVNLINHLPPDAYRHAVVCIEDYSDFHRRIERPDVELIALHRSRIGARALRIALFRLFRRLRPALVHTRNLSGLDALLPARCAGVAHCIHSEHGWDIDNLDGRQWRPRLLRRLHAPLVDRYITVSKDLERYLVQRVGIRPARVTQIYNGVDTERFAPAPPGSCAEDRLPPAFRGAGVLRIGTIGRLQPVKDQATLLHAVAAALRQRPELRATLRLLVIGDGPLRAELERLAHALGIDALTWFAGSTGAVAELLSTLDVFVLPSLNEGISNTILEAMAAGVPVIATAVGGNIELIDDGGGGRLFAPGDQATLSEALMTYLADPALRRACAAAGRRRALERFSLAAMLAAYRNAYDDVCRSGR